MSCNTCEKRFGLLTREKACPNCGFSYCSGCLKYKQFVAKLDQTVKVCGPCNRILSNPKAKETPRSPPSALKKRLEKVNSLPVPKHPVTIYQEGKIAKLRFGLPVEDQEIADRLQQLKTKPQEDSEEEIKARLDKLRGVETPQQQPTKQTPMTRLTFKKPGETSSVQAADKLMKQMSDEIALDQSMPNPDEELEERLAKLKGVDVNVVRNPGKGLDKPPEAKSKEPDPLEIIKLSTSEEASSSLEIVPVGSSDVKFPDDSKAETAGTDKVLHDHSSYTSALGTDEELAKDIEKINKEKETQPELKEKKVKELVEPAHLAPLYDKFERTRRTVVKTIKDIQATKVHGNSLDQVQNAPIMDPSPYPKIQQNSLQQKKQKPQAREIILPKNCNDPPSKRNTTTPKRDTNSKRDTIPIEYPSATFEDTVDDLDPLGDFNSNEVNDTIPIQDSDPQKPKNVIQKTKVIIRQKPKKVAEDGEVVPPAPPKKRHTLYEFPIVEEVKKILEFANEDGIIENFKHEFECKTCHFPFNRKDKLHTHVEKKICQINCRWKEFQEHEHKWVNKAFATKEQAMRYLEKEFNIFYVFNQIDHTKVVESDRTMYRCKQRISHNCGASLVLHKSKRFVKKDLIARVYDITGCHHHNHQVITHPCRGEHEHQIIDEVYPTVLSAEERIQDLSTIHNYSRRDHLREERSYFSCKRKDPDALPNSINQLCKAHIYLLKEKVFSIQTLCEGGEYQFQYRVRGCLNHCHAPARKNVLCCEDHDHQVIDMSFPALADFLKYLEDNEMDHNVKKFNDHLQSGGKYKIHKYNCSKHIHWGTRYKTKKERKTEFYKCPAALYVTEPLKSKSENVIVTGCLTHNHEIQKSKFTVKFRKEVDAMMEELGMSKEQKHRNFRRFREKVCQMKKKHGSTIVGEFTAQDIIVSRECITFKDNFIDQNPLGADVLPLTKNRNPVKVTKARRELKQKRLLEKLRYVHNLVHQMELNEADEDYMDKTVNALKHVPNLSNVFAPGKRKAEEQPASDEPLLAPPSPKKKRKSSSKQKSQPQEEIVHYSPSKQEYRYVHQGGSPIKQEYHYIHQGEEYPYAIVTTTQGGENRPTSLFEPSTSAGIHYTFR